MSPNPKYSIAETAEAIATESRGITYTSEFGKKRKELRKALKGALKGNPTKMRDAIDSYRDALQLLKSERTQIDEITRIFQKPYQELVEKAVEIGKKNPEFLKSVCEYCLELYNMKIAPEGADINLDILVLARDYYTYYRPRNAEGFDTKGEFMSDILRFRQKIGRNVGISDVIDVAVIFEQGAMKIEQAAKGDMSKEETAEHIMLTRKAVRTFAEWGEFDLAEAVMDRRNISKTDRETIWLYVANDLEETGKTERAAEARRRAEG